MRLPASFVLLIQLLASHAVIAQPAKVTSPPKDPEAVDIGAAKSRFLFFTNDDGLIIAVDPTYEDRQIFAGDGKILYQQTIYAGGTNGSSDSWQYSTWSPRALASLEYTPDRKYLLTCGGRDQRKELRQLPRDESARILATAQFRKPFWKRRAELLLRDDVGTYYYVDRLENEGESAGYRVFIGKKGAMKEVAMTNLVDDSAGKVYGTKRGDIRIVTRNNDDGTAYWVRGKKKFELIKLPLTRNAYLIYRGLGIYGALGTLCDDA